MTKPASPGPVISEVAAAGDELVDALAQVWSRGWTPTEVLRVAELDLGATHVGLVALAIGIERRVNPLRANKRWLGELDDVAQRAPWRDFAHFHEMSAAPANAIVSQLIQARVLVACLPRMAAIIDPPGVVSRGGDTRQGSQIDSKLLERVRALLAKAEGSEFPHEADAFTSKAQQIMADHSIELAMLSDPAGTAPAATRIWHARPYTSAKSTLLSCIAGANGCRTVWHPAWSVSTVFGFRHDLDAVEVLHTSLLVQAVAEMSFLESQMVGDRRRIKSFRSSFFIGFGHRIGERLREARAEAADRAGSSDESVLPVLARRDDEVQRSVEDVFPHLSTSRVSLSNSAGYRAGTIAGGRATFGADRSRIGH